MTDRRWWGAGALVALVVAAIVVWAAGHGDRSPTATAPVPSTSPPVSSAPLPSAPASPSPPGSPAGPSAPGGPGGPGDCAEAVADGMSPAERAGQLLMVGTPVDDPREIGGAVARYHLGGIFLAGRSTRPAGPIRADITAVQRDADVPLLVALDQEGGSVQTLKGPDFPILASALRLGDGPVSALRRSVGDSARRLRGVGVTVNLAPVADTVPAGLGEGNPPIGAFHRQYGDDPGAVATDIRAAVTASQDAGVLTVVKHFPGLGRVRANTDTSTRAVDAMVTATDPYLEPFVAGMTAGSAGVMVSSARYPKLDGRNIAAFSKPIITGLLRDRLGFTGLVISDDLGAADAAETVPVGDRAVRFVAAGGDLVLTIRPQDARPMTGALIAAAAKSPSFAARVDDAARHVLRAKHRAGLLTCPA